MDESDLTAEGWAVEDHTFFRLMTEHPPPRPYGYANQLWVDLRSWKPALLWIAAITLLVVGVTMRQWYLLLPGAGLAAFYFRAVRGTVEYLREAPTAIGRIDGLSGHPILPDYSTAVAELADGRKVRVAVRTRLASWIVKRGQSAEVLILLDDRSEYCMTLAARAWTR